jgi:putative alpha-1,2-mannosidase
MLIGTDWTCQTASARANTKAGTVTQIPAPWTYDLIGEPWKTFGYGGAAQALFTNAPNGVTGNDLGTMSGWYVFSALGFYPVMPGSGHFALNVARFPRIEVTLQNGCSLRICVLRLSDPNAHIDVDVAQRRGGRWTAR